METQHQLQLTTADACRLLAALRGESMTLSKEASHAFNNGSLSYAETLWDESRQLTVLADEIESQLL